MNWFAWFLSRERLQLQKFSSLSYFSHHLREKIQWDFLYIIKKKWKAGKRKFFASHRSFNVYCLSSLLCRIIFESLWIVKWHFKSRLPVGIIKRTRWRQTFFACFFQNTFFIIGLRKFSKKYHLVTWIFNKLVFVIFTTLNKFS